MRNSLKQCAVILACSLFIFSVFAVFIWDVNREVIGQEDPQPPNPPPDPCTTGYCGDNCCSKPPSACCGEHADQCCSNGCCCGANGGSCCHGECCSDMPCCPGQCCSKQTGTEPGPSGPTPIYSYDCCERASGEHCCNEECSECSGNTHCIQKYGNDCYVCDHTDTPCQCKMRPDYIELTSWDDWLNCPILGQHPDKKKEIDGCSVHWLIQYVAGIDDPDNPSGCASFANCCEGHDGCYQTCDTNKSYDQGTCDDNFNDSLWEVCIDNSGCGGCMFWANLYYGAVVNYGEGPWKGDQIQFCVCCGTG